MTTEEFLERARTEIPNDPWNRLTLLSKTLLQQPDCVIDVHVHIFDKKCLSIGYILLRLVKRLALGSIGFESTEESPIDDMELLTKTEQDIYEDILEKSEDTDEEWEQFEKEVEAAIKMQEELEEFEAFGFSVKDALKVLRKKNMKQVLDFYHDEFSIVNLDEFTNSKMVTGILQMDLETGWGFNPRRAFKQQIDDLKEISKTRPILPYIAIDPRRAEKEGDDENLYKLFLDAFTDPNTPFFGVKCYPSLGYDPSDIRLDPIFQICAEKKIPVLTHCGGESVSTYEKTIELKTANGYEIINITGNNRKERARYLNEPKHWLPVLEKYNELKLNLGHFGGGTSWKDYGENGTNERIETILEMMENPDWNVYADFSYGLVENDTFPYLKAKLDSAPNIAAKTLFGTDYWVVLPAGDLLIEQRDFLNYFSEYKDAMLRENQLKYLLK